LENVGELCKNNSSNCYAIRSIPPINLKSSKACVGVQCIMYPAAVRKILPGSNYSPSKIQILEAE
jgi:hypothetical protein